MHRLVAFLMIAAAFGSACGTEEDEAAPGTTDEAAVQRPSTEEAPSMVAPTETEPATTIGEPERAATGREIFVEAGCGDCHTLEAAGTTGTVGPDLDEHLRRGHGGTRHIAMQIRRGGPRMPSFRGRLTDDEIRQVARFVHRATGLQRAP